MNFPKNIRSILFQIEVKKLENYFFSNLPEYCHVAVKKIVYDSDRGLHVHMILFYYVNWLLNLLLQKSVASLLSLRMRSIEYLTIGEN